MTIRYSLLFLLVFLGMNFNAKAAIQPSFGGESCAWDATDIVAVTEGDKIDGQVLVLEAWKGDLKPGDDLRIPELAAFTPQSAREVSNVYGGKALKPPSLVTGSRLVLFLQKPLKKTGQWIPGNRWGDMKTSVVWIEQGGVYGFVQVNNPGASVLIPLGLSEEKLKAGVNDVIQTQEAMFKACALRDPAQRAQAIGPFARSEHFMARRLAFSELPRCGKAAVPVLRALLHDKAMLDRQGDVVTALGKAGGVSVGAELTTMVESETRFWKQTAPKLKGDWWNGRGVPWTESEKLRNRYSKLYSALRALNQMRYSGCRSAVAGLRDFWRSLPQLEDKRGLDQMSVACDNVLANLDALAKLDADRRRQAHTRHPANKTRHPPHPSTGNISLPDATQVRR